MGGKRTIKTNGAASPPMLLPANPHRKSLIGMLLVLLAVAAAYSNHFQNSFHFDDWHTVVGNVSIQNVRNLPRFFVDPALFSTLATHQVYQPVTSATLAIDYWLGGGLNPLYFHLLTFVWFLFMLVLLFLLFQRIMDLTDQHPSNWQFALLATACYGLHPAIAETVNYIIQRADIYSTLGVVAGLALYIYWPASRKWGWYMLPALVGMLAKAPALMFPLILLAYVCLFELPGTRGFSRVALKPTLPAFLTTTAAALLILKMTPAQFTPGASSALLYRATQPFVAWHYFRSFFLPTELSADTDWAPVSGIFSTDAILGFVFVAVLLALALHAARHAQSRPIAFGIVWFFLAQVPTSLQPLAEVTNDHRMFFPFIGLALAAVWSLRLLLFQKTSRLTTHPLLVRAAWIAAACILIVAAVGTWQRNRVWHSEESLWRDVTLKSPKNGRGLMNYGLTQMSKGDYATALRYFEQARIYTPNYSTLEINIGIANGGLGREHEAESHFLRALALAPGDADPHYYYGRWLSSQGRAAQSITELETALQASPNNIDARRLLMQTYFEQHQWDQLRRVANDTLRLDPDEVSARRFLASAQTRAQDIAAAEREMHSAPSVDGLINLSLLYYQDAKYPECIRAAQRALQLNPASAEAYNNIAAAYNSMAMWDDGIQAAKEATRLKPDFQLARNNLEYAIERKQRANEPRASASRSLLAR